MPAQLDLTHAQDETVSPDRHPTAHADQLLSRIQDAADRITADLWADPSAPAAPAEQMATWGTELASLVGALDIHLSHGGHLPQSWIRPGPADGPQPEDPSEGDHE